MKPHKNLLLEDHIDKLPQILILPIALVGSIIFGFVYIVLATISLFMWGTPRDVIEDFLEGG